MANYDYECKDCNKEFEVSHRMSETWEECLHCNSKNIEKVIRATPVHFGSGNWFSKDGKY